MARDVIDELSLKIDIKTKKDIDKTINTVAEAIRNLNDAVADVSKLRKYVNTLRKLSLPTAKALRKTGVGQATKTKATPQLKTEEVNVGTTGEKELKKVEKSNKVQKETIDQEKDLSEQTEELGKNAKKTNGFWSKFIKSIGRIALYRVIRSAIKGIASAFTEGLANVRTVDKTLDKSLKNLSNSATSLKNSFASIFAPIINAIAPLVTKIADGIATIINRINEAKAALKGSSKYTKILTSDTKEWQEQLDKVAGNLLSFDKFEALTQPTYTGVVEADVGISGEDAEKIVDTVERITKAVAALGVVIGALKVTELISNIGKITEGLDKTDTSLTKSEKSMRTLEGAVSGLGLAMAGVAIFKLAKDWDDMTVSARALAIGVAALGIAIFAAFNLAKMGVISFKTALISTGIGALIVAIGVLVAVIVDNWDWIKEHILEPIKKWFVSVGNWFKKLWGQIKDFCNKVKSFFVDLWHNIANGFAGFINKIVNGFVAFVNKLIDGVNTFLKPIDAVAGWFGGNVEIPHWNFQMNWQPYADGGEFTKGTAFIAGEAGAEVVYNTRGGNGGVANIDQIREAEYLGTYQALLDYGAARGDLSSLNGMTVVLDGKKVGQLVAGDVIREGRRVGYLSATK